MFSFININYPLTSRLKTACLIKSAFLALILSGCNKSGGDMSNLTPDEPAKEFTTYTIKKGEHYSNGKYKKAGGKELLFEVIFDSSCIYSSNIAENASDINKLYGFSDCDTRHHENSARVGWLWNGEAIELYAYCYSDSRRSSAILGTTTIGKTNTISISVSSTHYIFIYDGRDTKMDRHCSDSTIKGYMLYPYFGGDETAPHDIHIRIK